jgi:hypothetical protein
LAGMWKGNLGDRLIKEVTLCASAESNLFNVFNRAQYLG